MGNIFCFYTLNIIYSVERSNELFFEKKLKENEQNIVLKAV